MNKIPKAPIKTALSLALLGLSSCVGERDNSSDLSFCENFTLFNRIETTVSQVPILSMCADNRPVQFHAYLGKDNDTFRAYETLEAFRHNDYGASVKVSVEAGFEEELDNLLFEKTGNKVLITAKVITPFMVGYVEQAIEIDISG